MYKLSELETALDALNDPDMRLKEPALRKLARDKTLPATQKWGIWFVADLESAIESLRNRPRRGKYARKTTIFALDSTT